MNILYIDEQSARADTCARILLDAGAGAVKLAHNLTNATKLLNTETFDAIVSYKEVGGKAFSTEWPLFLGVPYFILGQDNEFLSLPQPPASILGNKLDAEAARDVLFIVGKHQQITANLVYAENMADGDTRFLQELIQILQTQFMEGLEKIPYLYQQKGWEDLFQIIHKFTGKFAVLGMKDTHLFFIRVEAVIRNGYPLPFNAFKRIIASLQQGLDFINFYMDANELHHS